MGPYISRKREKSYYTKVPDTSRLRISCNGQSLWRKIEQGIYRTCQEICVGVRAGIPILLISYIPPLYGKGILYIIGFPHIPLRAPILPRRSEPVVKTHGSLKELVTSTWIEKDKHRAMNALRWVNFSPAASDREKLGGSNSDSAGAKLLWRSPGGLKEKKSAINALWYSKSEVRALEILEEVYIYFCQFQGMILHSCLTFNPIEKTRSTSKS